MNRPAYFYRVLLYSRYTGAAIARKIFSSLTLTSIQEVMRNFHTKTHPCPGRSCVTESYGSREQPTFLRDWDFDSLPMSESNAARLFTMKSHN